MTSAEIAQQPDLRTVVDVLDGHARDQAVDRQMWPVVSGTKLHQFGVVEYFHLRAEAVLRRVEPSRQSVPGSRYLEETKAEALILECPVG